MMTTQERSTSNRNGERGVALIAALLLLMIVSALCATMAVSGSTDTVIARNHQVATEARAAAEAGIIHGTQLIVAHLQTFAPGNVPGQINALLAGPDGDVATTADNGSLENLGLGLGAVALNGSPQISYQVRVYDEDDANRGVTLDAADIARIGEDTQAYVDNNKKVLVRAVGYAGSNAVATVEVLLGPIPMPAVLTQGDMDVAATITGSGGGVHSNEDLTVEKQADIQQNATSSGTFTDNGGTVGGTTGGGKSTITVPPVKASDYASKADFILNDDGTFTIVATNTTLPADPTSVWSFAGGTWTISGNVGPTPGAYYVEGNVSISGNPDHAGGPCPLSIFAAGDISISGNPDMDPYDASEPWLVSDGDLTISGNVNKDGFNATHGEVYVGGDLTMSGNPMLNGNIVVQGDADIKSNVQLQNNGTGSSSSYEVSAWRWGS